MTIEQHEADSKVVLTRRDRVMYWWWRRPPSIRKLIVGGVIASIVLLGLGLWFDALGEAWGKRHPFLVSLPGDLFRLVALGTVGVFFIDGLKAWSRSWTAIGAVIPILGQSAKTFLAELCEQIGVREPFGLGGELLGPFNECREIMEYFEKLNSLLVEQAFDPILDGTLLDIPPEEVRAEWAFAPKLSEPHHRRGADRFEQAAAGLSEVLGELRELTSPATAGTIAACMASVSSIARSLEEIRETLNSIETRSTPWTPLEAQRLYLDAVQPLDSMLRFLRIALELVEYEGAHGREFPARIGPPG
jgi:hypothetical protein